MLEARDDLDSLKATEVRVRKMSSQQKLEGCPFYRSQLFLTNMYVSIFVFFLALNYPSLKKLEEIIVEGIFTHNCRFL